MPDLKYCGGYRGLLAIADAAAAHGVGVLAAQPDRTRVQPRQPARVRGRGRVPQSLEYQLAESPLYTELVHGVAPRLVDGAFEVPDTPGVGATLDAAVVAAHPWQRLPAGANLDERLG